ncbi:hypothetical protein GCM10017776_09700 [Streptomyces griseoluteus]|nr:hypothetical protein GCM10017776_09700 [Streptomyces griseoluteus]
MCHPFPLPSATVRTGRCPGCRTRTEKGGMARFAGSTAPELTLPPTEVLLQTLGLTLRDAPNR